MLVILGAIQKPRRQPRGEFLILSTSTYIKSVYVGGGGVKKSQFSVYVVFEWPLRKLWFNALIILGNDIRVDIGRQYSGEFSQIVFGNIAKHRLLDKTYFG